MAWGFVGMVLVVRHGFATLLLFTVGVLVLTSNYVIFETVNTGDRRRVNGGKRALQNAFSYDYDRFSVKLNSDEMLMEDQRDLISILNPEGLQQFDKSVTEEKIANDPATQLAAMQKSLQAAHQLSGLLPVKLQGVGYLTPKMLQTADRSYYLSLAESHGLQYKNRSQEEMFLKEFIRSDQCRRILSLNRSESLALLQKPFEKELISPQSVVILTDHNGSKYARQKLLDYSRLHSYNYAVCKRSQKGNQSNLGWKLSCVEEALKNESNRIVTWVDGNVFITNSTLRLENFFQLPSKFAAVKSTTVERSADFLSTDLIVAVNDWTDPYEFLKTDMLVVRNSPRSREFLAETSALHLHLRLNQAKYGQIDSQLLSLAYYRATEFCLHTLLLPRNGLLTSSLTKWQLDDFSLNPPKRHRKIFRLLTNIPSIMWPKVIQSVIDK